MAHHMKHEAGRCYMGLKTGEWQQHAQQCHNRELHSVSRAITRTSQTRFYKRDSQQVAFLFPTLLITSCPENVLFLSGPELFLFVCSFVCLFFSLGNSSCYILVGQLNLLVCCTGVGELITGVGILKVPPHPSQF